MEAGRYSPEAGPASLPSHLEFWAVKVALDQNPAQRAKYITPQRRIPGITTCGKHLAASENKPVSKSVPEFWIASRLQQSFLSPAPDHGSGDSFVNLALFGKRLPTGSIQIGRDFFSKTRPSTGLDSKEIQKPAHEAWITQKRSPWECASSRTQFSRPEREPGSGQ